MTPPVHSGEPETPRHNPLALADALEKATDQPRSAFAEHVVISTAFRNLLANALREAAALAPGAGLDVERLAAAITAYENGRHEAYAALPGAKSRMRITPSLTPADAPGIAAEYDRLGATPAPRPEADPS